MTKIIWITLGSLLISFGAIGQVETDSIGVRTEPTEKWVPSPKRAALLSLLPGAGQIYNKKLAYVKAPIIYAGFIGVGWWARDNQRTYERYRDAYELSVNGEPHIYGITPSEDLKRARDDFDKFRQRTYITLGVIYMAQIIEAYVSAHLIDFDIDDDLSVKIGSTIQDEYEQNIGLGAIISF